MSFPDQEQYTGIFIKAPLAEDGAPAAVAAINADFKNGSCTGTISFTAPTTTFAGGTLTGELTYDIKANGKSVATGKTTAGATVNKEVTLPGGVTKISVTTANAEGNSPATVVEMFIGKDAPTAVENLKLEITDRDNGKVKLTWTAPTTTANGGYLDTKAMRYKVVRNSDGTVVANDLSTCEFTETLGTETLSQYSYTVTPYVGELVGAAATSNSIKLGTHCLVPYIETFDSKEALDNFTIIDGYDDGYTWAFRDGWDMAQSRYSFKNPMDEWLITPPIYLQKGKLYKLTFTSSSKRVYPDRLEVKMGQGTAIEDMVTTLVKDTLYKTDEYIPDVVYDFDIDVKVEKDGDYHIGFHAMAEPQMSDLRLDDISLTYVSELGCPQRVTNLTATAGEKGALNATISFTTPTKTFEGDNLSSLTKAEIYKDDKLVGTIENPGIGQQVSKVVEADQGMNEYKVYTCNENGKSLDSKVSVYCGVSKPAQVNNVVLKEEGAYPVIRWEAPTVGDDGGYIDPSKLTYTVLRGNDQTIVASNITETSFTDKEMDGQILQVYLVYASNAAGMSKATYSNYIVVGNGRYNVPFRESFANTTITQQPWSNTSTGSSSWWLTKDAANVKTYDGDDGMIYFQGEAANETGSIFSGKISLANTSKPTLVTYVYYDESMKFDIKLRIMGTTDYVDFKTLKEIDYNNFDGEIGWNKIVVPLDEFKDKPWMAVAYDATTGAENFQHSIFMAHSGDQALGSFSSESGATDNWLISPKLSGEAQLITFYVRTTVPNFGFETFEVLTSTTDDDAKSFTKVENIDGNAPYEWTKISFAVPAGTNYFAIRGTSNQCLLMLVDDITYIPAGGETAELNVVGYNVYRDGMKLNATPITKITYTDAVEPNTTYKYQVSVVYEEGESMLSAPCVITTTTTGISTATDSGISIEARNGKITVNNCAGKHVNIYNTAGGTVYSGMKFTQCVSVNVANGAYVVECDGMTKKVIVK